MQVPIIQLSQASQKAAKRILKASKNDKISLCQQMQMANYYSFLHSRAISDKIDFAKLLAGK